MTLQITKYNKWLLASLLMLALHTYAQTVFHGVLINSLDSSVIPYAGITLKGTGKSAVTDTDGSFQFVVPGDMKKVTLSILAIGIKTSITYTVPFKKKEMIYVDVEANALNDFAVKGLSAMEVVKKAVAAIPDNYADSSYFDYSFYRRYQKLNGRYVNLFEACPVIMFQVGKVKHELKASEAFAVNHLRRSKFHPDIMNSTEDNPLDLINQNPIYHFSASSLLPSRFPNFYFRFDTTNKSREDYVVQYVWNNASTDNHGIGNYAARGLRGEEYEIGRLVIDRKTFAIKKIDRKSLRHTDYGYSIFYPENNLVQYAYTDYLFEFVDGDLEVEYTEHNGKWYLDKMFRQYTNRFVDPYVHDQQCVITDNFEWNAGPMSRYTTDKYAGKFYSKMATAIHSYDTAFWEADSFPFYYADKEEVYKNLERDGPVEEQFSNEALIDEYVKKKD